MKFQRIGNFKTCTIVNPVDNSGKKNRTVVIGGIPRGGTTMVAAAVEALGVYLGPEEDLRDFTFEDQVMNRPYLNEQHDRIKENDANHTVWGWKDPGVIHPLNELGHALREPRVIIVFRDMLASIQGELRFDEENGLSRPIHELVDNTMDRYAKNWEFIKRTRLPTLLVSYERAINNKEEFVNEMIDFIGISPNPEQKQNALNRISEKGGYLKSW